MTRYRVRIKETSGHEAWISVPDGDYEALNEKIRNFDYESIPGSSWEDWDDEIVEEQDEEAT